MSDSASLKSEVDSQDLLGASWDARLAEARARREIALKEKAKEGKTKPLSESRPWEAEDRKVAVDGLDQAHAVMPERRQKMGFDARLKAIREAQEQEEAVAVAAPPVAAEKASGNWAVLRAATAVFALIPLFYLTQSPAPDLSPPLFQSSAPVLLGSRPGQVSVPNPGTRPVDRTVARAPLPSLTNAVRTLPVAAQSTIYDSIPAPLDFVPFTTLASVATPPARPVLPASLPLGQAAPRAFALATQPDVGSPADSVPPVLSPASQQSTAVARIGALPSLPELAFDSPVSTAAAQSPLRRDFGLATTVSGLSDVAEVGAVQPTVPEQTWAASELAAPVAVALPVVQDDVAPLVLAYRTFDVPSVAVSALITPLASKFVPLERSQDTPVARSQASLPAASADTAPVVAPYRSFAVRLNPIRPPEAVTELVAPLGPRAVAAAPSRSGAGAPLPAVTIDVPRVGGSRSFDVVTDGMEPLSAPRLEATGLAANLGSSLPTGALLPVQLPSATDFARVQPGLPARRSFDVLTVAAAPVGAVTDTEAPTVPDTVVARLQVADTPAFTLNVGVPRAPEASAGPDIVTVSARPPVVQLAPGLTSMTGGVTPVTDASLDISGALALVRPLGEASPSLDVTPPQQFLSTPLSISILVPPSTDIEEAEALNDAMVARGHTVRQVRPVDVPISTANVRYFHAQDREGAEAIAASIGATARDFTTFRPSPSEGTVEVWLKGSRGSSGSVAAATPPRSTTTRRSTAPAAAPPVPTPDLTQPQAPRPIIIVRRKPNLLQRILGGSQGTVVRARSSSDDDDDRSSQRSTSEAVQEVTEERNTSSTPDQSRAEQVRSERNDTRDSTSSDQDDKGRSADDDDDRGSDS